MSAVEGEEGDIGDAVPADKVFHELGAPLGTPSHKMLKGRQTPKAPLCWAARQETKRHPQGPARHSSFRAKRLAVYRALYSRAA
jgi:hypothetical protein